MNSGKDPNKRERSDSDAVWEKREQERGNKTSKILGGDVKARTNEAAPKTNQDQPQAGDILIFKIEKEKPGAVDRFIRFAQRLKGTEHPEDADAVHAAIVTKVGTNNIEVAHFSQDGLKMGDSLSNTKYSNSEYEIFRPNASLRKKMEAEINSLKDRNTNPVTDVVESTKYTLRKMVAAFLSSEKKPLKGLAKQVPDMLYHEGYEQHVCSTFVADVVKKAQGQDATAGQKTVDTSYLLPSKLFAKLKADQTNFNRIVPNMSNKDKCDKLMGIVDQIVARLESQQKSVSNPNKSKIQAKIDQIQAAKTVYQHNKTDDPSKLVAIMSAPIAVNTGTGLKQSSNAQLFLQEARKLGVDTAQQETALTASTKQPQQDNSKQLDTPHMKK